MSSLKEWKSVTLGSSESLIGFATTGGGSWEKWDRFLTLEGKQAYHIGNICNTCSFFFERLDGANQSTSVPEAIDQMSRGIRSIDGRVIKLWGNILPVGKYFACLFDTQPQLVALGTTADYFANEQINLWGLDAFWGMPHHPRVEYYRLGSRTIQNGCQLFEFLVPMFPQNWLKIEDVQRYERALANGERPTSVAISILDIKGPATFEKENEITEHWCLTHYLLDGHHKCYAAARSGLPITLLSFLAVNEGISDETQIQLVLDALQMD